MVTFINSKTNLETSTPEESSKPIGIIEAITFMNNYQANSLDLYVNPTTAGDPMPIKGFYFDAADIKKLVANLNDITGQVYIGLAKKSNDKTIKNDYTLVITCVEYYQSENKYKFKFDSNLYPWFEFSRPCPDKCPE